jgi:hypothetical protein
MCRTTAFGQYDLRRECRRCHGLGFRILPPERLAAFQAKISNESRDEERQHQREQLRLATNCKACHGDGYISQRPKTRGVRADPLATTVGCPACRGSDARHLRKKPGPNLGDAPEPLYPSLMRRHWGSSCGETIPPTDASAERGDVCPRCLGSAFLVPITARPNLRTADQPGDEEQNSEPDEDADGDDSASVARVVERLADADDLLMLGLRVLSGEHGERWSASSWGRSFALWPLGEAGERLASESRAASDEDDRFARELALCRAERDAQSEHPNPRRQALINQADGEARAFERRVVSAILGALGAQ